MEKKDNFITIEFENFPYFGTNCSVIDNKNYFVQFTPKANQTNYFKNSHLCVDPSSYFKKETFYIYYNSVSDGEGL